MNNDLPEENSDIKNAAKKGGKEILSGFSKAGMILTKRVAEGVFQAQLAQTEKEDTAEKIIAASSEMGKAIIKGAIEGTTETIGGVLTGVNTIADAIKSNKKNEKDEK